MNRIIQFIKRHSVAVRLGVVVILFWLLFRAVSPAAIVREFLSADIRWLSVAAVLMVPNILLQILKWRFVLRTVSPHPSFRTVTMSLLGGFFLGAASPGRTGEIARGVFIRGTSLLKLASLTIVDKGFNQIVVVIVGLVSLAFLLPLPVSVLLVAIDIVFIVSLINLHRLRPVFERLLHRFTHSDTVDNALAAFDALSPGTVIGMSLYSVAFYLVYAVQYYIMMRAFFPVSAVVALKTIPVVYLINLCAPLSFGDFGVKEFAAVHLLRQFGAVGEAVFGATLLNNVLTFLLPSVAGGIISLIYRPEHVSTDRSSDDRTAPIPTRSSRRAVS